MVSGDGLARVTYLPGVKPPPSPEAVGATADMQALPTFAGFFGTAAADYGVSNCALEQSVAAGSVVNDSASNDSASNDSGVDDSASNEVESPDPDFDDSPRDEDFSSRGGSNRREVRAERVSMHALTRRGMSRWELEKTLLSRELEAEVVEAELDRLEAVGLIDDAALAETFVRTQHERKGLGRGAITAELRRRHVAPELIDAALEQIADDDEQTRANELALKRAGQLSSYDLETAKRRLHGFLSRKGYSSAVVRTAIDEALSSGSGSGSGSGSATRSASRSGRGTGSGLGSGPSSVRFR